MKWKLGALAMLLCWLPLKAQAGLDGQMECLAKAVYWEARNQPFNAQVAVAQVILNRVEDGRFRADICGVVFQRDSRGCQFTWVCTNATRRPRDQHSWHIAQVAAYVAVFDYIDMVNGAIFFHDTSVRRWQQLERTARIGELVFYRER
jgi:spore germination cell wall hydrolase CwlJ-like protein